jgi:hypothetical protein
MVTVKEIVKETYTNTSGFNLYIAIRDYFDTDRSFELSFDGISSTSSSFLNSSFGALIEEFGVDKFTSLVKIKNVTKGEAEIIKKYVLGFKNTSKKI